MINQNIQFKILNEAGLNINCTIVASLPVSDTTINIMYKREDDPADLFRYGKIIKTENSYEIKKDISDEELLSLKEMFEQEIINMAQEVVEQSEVA